MDKRIGMLLAGLLTFNAHAQLCPDPLSSLNQGHLPEQWQLFYPAEDPILKLDYQFARAEISALSVSCMYVSQQYPELSPITIYQLGRFTALSDYWVLDNYIARVGSCTAARELCGFTG